MKKLILCCLLLLGVPMVYGQIQDPADQSLSDFLVGSIYSTRGDCEKAIPYFRQALALHQDAVIYRELAECHYYQGNMEMAIELLEESIRLFPDDYLNHVDIGNIYHDLFRTGMASTQIAEKALFHLKAAWDMAEDVESGARAVEMAIAVPQPDTAVALYEVLPVEVRKHPQLVTRMIPVYKERKQYNHVRKLVRMLNNARVENPELLEGVANLSIELGFYREALELMRRRIELDPDTFSDWDRLMFIALAAEECEAVGEMYADRYREVPTPLALYSMANCLGRQHNYREAAELFKRSLEMGKHSWNADVTVDVLRDYLKILLADGRDTDALELLRQAVLEHPTLPGLMFDLVFTECINGNLTEAHALLDRLAELPENRFNLDRLRKQLTEVPSYPALYFRGVTLYSLEDYDRARVVLEKAYQLVQDDIDVVISLAFIYDREGNENDVIRIYEKALESHPDNPLLLNNFSYSLLIYGRDMKRALEMGRKAVSHVPESPVYRDTLGYGLMLQGALDEAYEHLRFAYEQRPEDGEVCQHLGELYFKKGDFDKARELWLEAIENGGVDEAELQKRIRFLDR